MSMNLRQLRSFVAIARLGNFTRAAQSLHVSQPALTVQMHQLEEALGVRLLDRNTRTVKLTSLGSQIVPIIERALTDIDTAIAGTKLTAESIGIVPLAGLPSLCSNLIPMAIARFNAQHPGISVRVHEIGMQRIAASVLEEEVELAIGMVEHPNPRLEMTPFLTDRLVVVCPLDHPLNRRRTIFPRDLADYPIIAFESHYGVRSLLDSALRAAGALRPPAHEVNFISTGIGMVRAGLGITVVSSTALERAVMTGLRARPIKHPDFAREISIIRKKGRTISPAAEQLMKMIFAVRDARATNGAGAARTPRRRVKAR